MKNCLLVKSILSVTAAIFGGVFVSNAYADTLFTNVNVFNGTESKLYNNQYVLVKANKIAQVSDSIIEADGAKIIDGSGKTLMPGMIDAHTHIMVNGDTVNQIETSEDPYDLGIRSVGAAKSFLMDGFTSIRDMGGPSFALKRQIDKGVIIGPRVYPSGAVLSQTSGHGDRRSLYDLGFSINVEDDVSNMERIGFGQVVDGVPEVLKATRLNLRHGATQIKIMAGGGGSSQYDPIDTTQFLRDEICAAVQAAADWGTYVAAHLFYDRAINRALDCGVKTFEHGFFASYKTYQRMAKEGAYLVPQMWGFSPELMNHPDIPKRKLPAIAELQKKYKDVGRLILKSGVKVAFQSDWAREIENANRSRRFEIWWRSQMFDGGGFDGKFETLKQLTSVGGELLAESGPRNSAGGKLGVIEEGAIADILIINGNPLNDLSVIGGRQQWYSQALPSENPIETIQLIMKDGVIYKNTL